MKDHKEKQYDIRFLYSMNEPIQALVPTTHFMLNVLIQKIHSTLGQGAVQAQSIQYSLNF